MDRPVVDFWPRHLVELHEQQEILDATTAYREELEQEDACSDTYARGVPGKQAPMIWCDCSNSGAEVIIGRCPECRSHVKMCGDCAGLLSKECACGGDL